MFLSLATSVYGIIRRFKLMGFYAIFSYKEVCFLDKVFGSTIFFDESVLSVQPSLEKANLNDFILCCIKAMQT